MRLRTIIVLFVVINTIQSSFGQKIPAVTMDEVVKYISKKNDTTYIVNFWSTYCAPCLEELPFIQRIAKKYSNKKVKLLLVSLDTKAFYEKQLPTFTKKHKITATTFWLQETNADSYCPKIDSSWSGVIPATLVINNNAAYRKFYETDFTAATFEAAIKSALQ